MIPIGNGGYSNRSVVRLQPIHGHIHAYAYGDSYIYAYRNGNSDGYSHGNNYGNCDCKPAAHTHAEASAYTAASALALSGIKGTRDNEVASSQLQSCSKSLTTAGRSPYKGGWSASLGFLKQSTFGPGGQPSDPWQQRLDS